MRITLNELRHYSALQQNLLFTLFKSQTKLLTEHNFRSELQKKGSIIFEAKRWNYYRHGDGIFFTDGKYEVDAIKYIFLAPSGFDAWRLRVYFESLGKSCSEKLIDNSLREHELVNSINKYPHTNVYVFNMSILNIN